jgi:hypothetical protein
MAKEAARVISIMGIAAGLAGGLVFGLNAGIALLVFCVWINLKLGPQD